MAISCTYWMLIVFGISAVFCIVTAQDSIYFTSTPVDQTVCVGDTAVVNCGVNDTLSSSPPALFINEFLFTVFSPINPELPVQFMFSNISNGRMIVGPISEQFVGTANVYCQLFILNGPLINTTTAAVTVLGRPGSPTITIEDTGLDSLSISWTVPQVDIDNVCGLVMYNVTLDGVTTTTTYNNITYTGLNHRTDHTITVTPYNNIGPSTPANITVTTLIPSVPFPPIDVQLDLKFIDGNVNITATWMTPRLANNMTEIVNYNLMLTVNSSEVFNTIVPVGNTMVDIFVTFPTVSRATFSIYTLSVAAINSLGLSSFTSPVSVVSSYIQEVSVTEATENITVSCTVTQSEPALICRAVFYCTGVKNSASLTLSNDVAQNFMTNRMCNVTIQVTSSSDFSQVLEESFFYNVSPSTSPPDTQPTPSSSPLPPNQDSNTSEASSNNRGMIAGIVIAVFLAIILAVAATILILFIYRRHQRMKKNQSPLQYSKTGDDGSSKPLNDDNRDGSSPSQNGSGSSDSAECIIPSYSTVHVVKSSDTKTAIVSQYSEIKDEATHAANGNVTTSPPPYSQVNKLKVTPEYSTVHKPTKAEGKVDNYIDLADIGPYPSKNAPLERVEYTDVMPSSFIQPQYSNMEHHHYTNGSSSHISNNNEAQHSTI